MGAFHIVVSAPILRLFLGVCKAQEPVGVQTFRSEPAVERFNERAIGRLAWSREVERDVALVSHRFKSRDTNSVPWSTRIVGCPVDFVGLRKNNVLDTTHAHKGVEALTF